MKKVNIQSNLGVVVFTMSLVVILLALGTIIWTAYGWLGVFLAIVVSTSVKIKGVEYGLGKSGAFRAVCFNLILLSSVIIITIRQMAP